MPATNKVAPSHHRGGRLSVKIKKERTAVTMKFADVLMIETWVVDVPAVRALVKRVHIMPLKMRLRAKNIYVVVSNIEL